MNAPNVSLMALSVAALVLGSCGPSEPTSDAPLKANRILSEGGKHPGQVLYPRAIDADFDGIWIVDKAGRVQRLDAKSGKPTLGFTLANIEQGKPTGITTAPLPTEPGRLGLWVAETHNFRIIALDPRQMTTDEQPQPVAAFGAYGEGPGQFIYVTDVAFLTNEDNTIERIYVSEYGGNDRISVFDAEYNFMHSFGRFGVGGSLEETASKAVVFNRPQSIEIDRQAGELIVADACNHRLGRFTLDGKLIAWIGSPTADFFRYPYGLTLLEGRRALVAEFGGNRLALVDLESGALLRRMGVPGREPGELASPWGLTGIGDEIFVLDSSNNRIQVIDAPATPQTRYAYPERGGGDS